jgi:oxygen-independent coproporphyrinogen-3 oxidase
MAGIYLHIPFCKKACHYCNFHFSTSLKLKNDFITALLKEIKLRYEYVEGEIIKTIYLGGGTPSLLSASELSLILSSLQMQYKVDTKAEITLEANPDDINAGQLASWKAAGVNRLSIGVQSFFDEDLIWMNRAHNASQSVDAIKLAQLHGFDNITIDLIFGTPGLSDERWEHNVKTALRLGIPHISCYALTVEPATALHKMIVQKKSADVVPEQQARQFLLLMDWMEDAGYEHYEISNFAKPGLRSRHNSSYWQGKKYLGLGPSAHSFNGASRQWNVANNALYIQGLQNEQLPVEIEHLTATQQLNEYIMIALRTIEGIDLLQIEKNFRDVGRIKLQAEKYIRDGKMEINENHLRLTKQGRLFADGIAGELFK